MVIELKSALLGKFRPRTQKVERIGEEIGKTSFRPDILNQSAIQTDTIYRLLPPNDVQVVTLRSTTFRNGDVFHHDPETKTVSKDEINKLPAIPSNFGLRQTRLRWRPGK